MKLHVAQVSPPNVVEPLLAIPQDGKYRADYPIHYCRSAGTHCMTAFLWIWGSVRDMPVWWGYVPSWMTSPVELGRPPLASVPVEKAAQSRLTRLPWLHQRCLVYADAFFLNAQATRYCVRRPDLQPMMLAGIWDQCPQLDPKGVLTHRNAFALLTCPASGGIERIATRMPMVVRPDAYQDWLSVTVRDSWDLRPLVLSQVAPLAEPLLIWPVSPHSEGKELLMPLAASGCPK